MSITLLAVLHDGLSQSTILPFECAKADFRYASKGECPPFLCSIVPLCGIGAHNRVAYLGMWVFQLSRGMLSVLRLLYLHFAL